jgi:ribokinase
LVKRFSQISPAIFHGVVVGRKMIFYDKVKSCSMPRIAAIGDFNEDLLMDVGGMAEPDSQTVAHTATSSGGGSAANFAVACSKMGADSALYAAVGDDHRGLWLLELASTMGVDISGVNVLEGVSTGVTVIMSHGGLRTMTSSPGSNESYDGNGFDVKNADVDWVHLTSYFLLAGLRPVMPIIGNELACRGVPVSFDPGWHHGCIGESDLAGLKSVISSAALFCPNLQEARAYLSEPDGDAERLALKGVEAGARICSVTIGEGGSVTCSDEGPVRVPAYDVKVVDSCGAGDVFAAGFVVARLGDRDLEWCARFAGAAAAISLRGPGWESYPTKQEVEELLSITKS